MDTRTKVGLGLVAVFGILSFIPSTNGTFLIIKIALFFGLLAFIYFTSSSGDLIKRVQVVVNDVREDRRDVYRKTIIGSLGSLGTTFTLNEEYGEVGVGVETARVLKDVKSKIDACNLKMQFRSVTGILRYNSLEATGEMTTMIHGKATPGSTIEIQGFKGNFTVDSNGSYAISVPLSLILKHQVNGYIPAKCRKGSLVDDIQIRIPK